MAYSKVDQSLTDALGAVDFTEKALESANAGTQKASTGSSRYNLAVSPEVETALDSLSEEHRNQFIKALKDYGYGLNNSETLATTTPEYTLSSTSSSNKGKLDFTPYGQPTLTDSQGQPTSAYQDLLDLANSKESQPLFNQSASNDYQIKKGDSLAKIGNLHYPDDKEKAAAASMLALQDLHGQNKLNINNKQNRINLTPGDKVNVDLSNYTSEEISALAKGFNKIQSAENKIDTFRQAQEEAKALARAQERQNRAFQARQARIEARNLAQDQAKQNHTQLTQQATQKSQASNYSPLYISPLFNLNKGNKVQTVIPYKIGAKSYIPKNSSPVSGGVSDFQNRKGLTDRINNLVNNLPHVSKSISNGAKEFGEKLMDNGAREENFVKYIVGRGSVASGEALDSGSAAIKRMADNPSAALSGILKGVVNSVADVPNTGINLGKTTIDGWTLIAEELPFIQRGALQSFRDSTPYNFPRPLEYSSKAEEDYSIFSPGPGVLAKGAKLLTKGASALGVTKMTSGVGAAKDLSVTEVTRKSPFAEVAKLEQKGHQSALTEKVLNNIADSARARDASNFSTHARTERILNNIADSANARRASNFYPHIGKEKRIGSNLGLTNNKDGVGGKGGFSQELSTHADNKEVNQLAGKTFDANETRRYIQDIQRITNRKIPANQIAELKNALRTTEYKKLPTTEVNNHRKEFNKVTNKLIEEWELNTNQTWPRYTENVYSKDGKRILRRAGEKYDAHHLIENSYGGDNKWWNIHPAKFPNEHQSGIHRSGGPSRKLFKKQGN